MYNYSKTDDELIEKTNKAIAELIYPKYELQKAYNYYYGKRDAEQFRYLEENFGIGNPTSVEFTPLIKKHIDVLVGEYLGIPILPKITCKDETTISKISREKEIQISNEVYKFLKDRLQNKLLKFIEKQGQDPLQDDTVKMEIDKLVEDLDTSFISSFESAAQDVLQYIIQSRRTDFISHLKQLLIDLLITGYTFYKVSPTKNNQNISIEVLNPLNTFVDRNLESPYIKDSYRVVIRRWYTQAEILNKYGKELSEEDINMIKDEWRGHSDDSYYYVRACGAMPMSDGIRAGEEVVIPGYPESYAGHSHTFDRVPVYEVEWLEVDDKFKMHRQSTVRIGEEIYILNEVDKNVVRSIDDPSKCELSVNGIYYLNRNSEPYSLMLACMSLQDKYDMLNFYRDNLIANSGTTGDILDISLLPAKLGVNFPERVQKYIAYKKQGIAMIDSAQEGRMMNGQAPLNTIFQGFDDTVKVQAVQAIQLAIEAVENTACSITGVFRERLNGIEQRDAVSNVKQGATNSWIITKQYFTQMDLVSEEILLDCLNTAKKVYKNGLTGELILGDKKSKVFTALPEHYTLTDFDVHIDTTTDTLKDLETLKQVLPNLVQGQLLSPDMIIEVATSKNLSQLKQDVKHSMKKQEEKNNQLGQLQQQLQELQQQLQQAQTQIKQYESQINEMDQAKLQLEQQKVKMQNDVDWFNAQTERQYKQSTAEQDKKRTEIELAQMYDGNPYNDQVKNV